MSKLRRQSPKSESTLAFLPALREWLEKTYWVRPDPKGNLVKTTVGALKCDGATLSSRVPCSNVPVFKSPRLNTPGHVLLDIETVLSDKDSKRLAETSSHPGNGRDSFSKALHQAAGPVSQILLTWFVLQDDLRVSSSSKEGIK